MNQEQLQSSIEDNHTLAPYYTIEVNKKSLKQPPTLLTRLKSSRTVLDESILLRKKQSQKYSIKVGQYKQSKKYFLKQKEQFKVQKNQNVGFYGLNIIRKNRGTAKSLEQIGLKRNLKLKNINNKVHTSRSHTSRPETPKQLLKPPQLMMPKVSKEVPKVQILPFITSVDTLDWNPPKSIVQNKSSSWDLSQQILKRLKGSQMIIQQTVSKEIGGSTLLNYSKKVLNRQPKIFSYMQSNRYQKKMQKIKKSYE